MKKLIAIFLAVSHLILPVYAAEQLIDRMIAIVNDDVITDRELRQAVFEFNQKRDTTRVAQLSDPVFRSQVLDQLVNQTLQLQQAAQLKLKVTAGEVNVSIQKLAKYLNLSIVDFYNHLRKEEISLMRYRQILHDQILLQKLQQKEAISQIEWTHEEFVTFKNQLLSKYSPPSQKKDEMNQKNMQEAFFQYKAEEAVRQWLVNLRGQAFIRLLSH